MFTSKHYQVLAEIIRDTWIDTMANTDLTIPDGYPVTESDRTMLMEGVSMLAIRLANNLAIDNPNFDRRRFFHACRLPGLT